MSISSPGNRSAEADSVRHAEQDALPAAARAPVVRLEAVRKHFRPRGIDSPVIALDDISLDIPEGEIVGIIGRSGAGKSTLVRLINGLEKADGGRVVVDGTDVSALDEKSLRPLRRRIGMIFQHFNLLSSRTAWDNVALPLEVAGVPRAEIRDRVGPLLELVGLSDKARRYPAELSGGQKQRVGIARALATRPRILLSDEATSALDPETTRSILALIGRINAELGVTVILITHEMQVVKEVARRVAVLDRGRLVEEGGTYEVLTRPRHDVTRSFLKDVTGDVLPAFLAERLQPQASPGSQAVLRLVFGGPTATDPTVSRLARALGLDVSILAGQVGEVAGRPFGILVVTVPSDPTVLTRALTFLAQADVHAEVLGHVA